MPSAALSGPQLDAGGHVTAASIPCHLHWLADATVWSAAASFFERARHTMHMRYDYPNHPPPITPYALRCSAACGSRLSTTRRPSLLSSVAGARVVVRLTRFMSPLARPAAVFVVICYGKRNGGGRGCNELFVRTVGKAGQPQKK